MDNAPSILTADEVPGSLTDAGRRWEELQREYAAKATEQWHKEYPEIEPSETQ